MLLVTQNVRDNPDMTRDQVRHDVDAVRRWVGPVRTLSGAAVLWQEFGEAEDHADAGAVMTKRRQWQHVETDVATPISLDRLNFDVLAAGTERMHGGRERVSPWRGTSWTIVRKRGRRRLPPFVIANKHTVSGAWTRAGQLGEEWRRDAWSDDQADTIALFADWSRSGLTIIGGGDLNRPGFGWSYAPRMRWLAGHRFDKLLTVPAVGGVVVEPVGDQLVLPTSRLHSDHAGLARRIRLSPPSRP